MLNPIIQTLQSKSNIINDLMKGGSPEALYNYMLQNNPQFARFVRENQGKTPQQIAEENGIDVSLLNQFIK